MQADMYAGGKGGEQARGFDQESGNARQGSGVKAAKASGERVDSYGDTGMEKDNDHLFRGLTRGTEAPMPFQNPSGIGTGGAEDVMRLISEGKGPMEADYKTTKVGSSLSGSGDGSRN